MNTLPALPEPLKQVAIAGYHDGTLKEPLEDYFDSEQMKQYALEAIRAEAVEAAPTSAATPGGPVASAAPGAGTLAYEMIMRVNDLCHIHKAIPESGADRATAMDAFTTAHRQLFDDLTAALAHPKPVAPDAYCVTAADGECISKDPRCMHYVR
jgi:hypothetical protein